jgi:putative membrane protein
MLRHALAAALLASLVAPARAEAPSQQDRDFLSYAAHDNQGEIRICLTAEKKAADPAVKAFARLMVDDHVQVESQLAAVVNGNGVSVPDDIGKDAQKTLSELEPLNGADFDRAFLKDQIEDHGKDIQRFTQEGHDTQDAAVRRFASLTIPVLQQHLALAQAVQDRVTQKSAPR